MINRIFIISALGTYPDALLPMEENVYACVAADPLMEGSLDGAWQFISNNRQAVGLELICRSAPTAELIRRMTAFCFLPFYLRIRDRLVILLTGEVPGLVQDVAAAITAYLESAGISSPMILFPAGPPAKNVFDAVPELSAWYSDLLETEDYYGNNLFFHAQDAATGKAAVIALRQSEEALYQRSPRLYTLARAFQRLEDEQAVVQKRQVLLEAELANQQEYVQVLRSNHQAKEIQDYYTREYEVLPLWFKRLGHMVKVLMGKRTFRSLYRDDVKKYKA